ncbi:hypothetical protein D9757_006617 [Collybiopsis confluens]|uniref:Uncharacterized protein n=1 Tax=Collybiopsis confluens TaxID=2823264 RepID=A0A8H5MBI5_9AGAR|nr:hypothetical protein D9757_006617 [Collybiopsis confluens]
MPTKLEYMKFGEWSNIYGPVMYLTAGRTKLLILNTLVAAQDLLEKRSVIYSNRPHLTMLMDVIGWDWSVALMNLGKQFSKHRRIIHKGLTADVQHFQEIQEQETAQLLIHLKEKPTEFMEQIEFWAKAITLRIAYGYRPSSNNDHYIWLAQQCANAISETGRPGAFWVDSFPLLRLVPKWIPGAGFKHKAAAWGSIVKEVLESPMQYALDNMQGPAVQKSYVGTLLRMNSQNELGKVNEIQAIKETAAIVHTAGSESVGILSKALKTRP